MREYYGIQKEASWCILVYGRQLENAGQTSMEISGILGLKESDNKCELMHPTHLSGTVV